eukprot:TRINITY_DN43864_c0_g1_i1.p1 TRINITY_DN43864_c0_g1~~TRINITY_DN43864_c0_g1_i1.p1  ORF type:complete len:201 (-),score=31.96 TRINITY_DN43864_c0_g1_i1:63-665(-)
MQTASRKIKSMMARPGLATRIGINVGCLPQRQRRNLPCRLLSCALLFSAGTNLLLGCTWAMPSRRHAVTVAVLSTFSGEVLAASDPQKGKLIDAVNSLNTLVDSFEGRSADSVRQAIAGLQIKDVLSKLALDASDPDTFLESLEEYSQALAQADGMAYSSVFSGGSGNPKANNPKVFMQKSLGELKKAQERASSMLKALG